MDYKNLDSQALYDYSVQKICSITASMATFAFNKSFASYVDKLNDDGSLKSFYQNKIEMGALFDLETVRRNEKCYFFGRSDLFFTEIVK